MTITYVAGPETRVNTTSANAQYQPAVMTILEARGFSAGYIVTWTSAGQDGSADGIYMQRYDLSGLALGIETRVNTTTANAQSESSITRIGWDGDYVVTWTSAGQDGGADGIYMQRYDKDGVAQGTETVVNTTTANAQNDPSVTDLFYGGYVVTWTSSGQDGGAGGIYMQRYDEFGVAQGTETRVNTTTANTQYQSSVTSIGGDGDFVVVWASNLQDGDGFGVYQQRYDRFGNALGPETKVNTATANSQFQPTVTSTDFGGYVVTWTSTGQDGSADGVYIQRYDLHGMALGTETRVNTTTANAQSQSSAAKISSFFENGDYIVTWTSDGQDGGGKGIYTQRYSAAGMPLGVETLVNVTTANDQFQPVITGLGGDGTSAGYGYVVTWVSDVQDGSGFGVYSRRYTLVDSVIGVASTTNFTGQALTDKDGIGFADNAIVTFTADQFGPGLIADTLAVSGNGYANTIVVNQLAAGTFSAAGWTFTNAPTGSDSVVLNGSSGSDSITGSSHNDILTGNSGSDTLIGGLGLDAVIYATDAAAGGLAGVYVSLTDGVAFDGFGTRDILSGFEIVYGTNATQAFNGQSGWSDFLTGDAGDNIFFGLAGNDYLDLGSGSDAGYGGDGDDYLFGRAGIDFLFGEAGKDYLDGGTGNDYLVGGSGSDVLIGGDGNDRLFGNSGALPDSTGNDLLIGGAGDDTISGSEGNDTILADQGTDYVYGNDGDDLIFSGAFNAIVVDCGSGNDTVVGGNGNEFVFGLAGNDVFDMGGGVDVMFGGSGTDLLYGGPGSDIYFGEADRDYFMLAGDIVAGDFDYIGDFTIGGVAADYIILPSTMNGLVTFSSSGGYAYGTISIGGAYYGFTAAGVTAAQLQAQTLFV
jgi:Ca2+-binding RTX toxin-like protein